MMRTSARSPIPHPLLYEINTRCWLRELSQRQGRPITLASVPDECLDAWQELGLTHLWLMGVWPCGPRARPHARAPPPWHDGGMIPRAVIDDFLAQRSLALVGVSASGRGFGHVVLKELGAKGYTLHLVHPRAAEIAGRPCARSLAEVASQVGGVVLVTPPAETEKLVFALGCER